MGTKHTQHLCFHLTAGPSGCSHIHVAHRGVTLPWVRAEGHGSVLRKKRPQPPFPAICVPLWRPRACLPAHSPPGPWSRVSTVHGEDPTDHLCLMNCGRPACWFSRGLGRPKPLSGRSQSSSAHSISGARSCQQMLSAEKDNMGLEGRGDKRGNLQTFWEQ